jgi:hypothetical protein
MTREATPNSLDHPGQRAAYAHGAALWLSNSRYHHVVQAEYRTAPVEQRRYSRCPDREATPARILAAQRDGTRQRLLGTGIPPKRVDELLAAFDALPERQGQPWVGDEAFQWALAQPRR